MAAFLHPRECRVMNDLPIWNPFPYSPNKLNSKSESGPKGFSPLSRTLLSHAHSSLTHTPLSRTLLSHAHSTFIRKGNKDRERKFDEDERTRRPFIITLPLKIFTQLTFIIP